MEELDRRGIRTKGSRLADGRVRGHIRFGAGPLAHLLKNRFYIGEIVYRRPSRNLYRPDDVDRTRQASRTDPSSL